jgi:lipopolysaccharide export system protein LptA
LLSSGYNKSNIHAEMKPTPTSTLSGFSLVRLDAARRLAGGWWMWALLLALQLGAASVQAQVADRDLPLEIDAGKVHIDGKRKVRLLSGGVEIRRGSLLIRAETIELRETPQGQQVTATGSEAQPALFRQKREGLDEVVEGRARLIEYDAGSEVVRLLQQAVLRRLSGNSVSEELSGETIVYDHARESFEVLSGGGVGDRVRAVVAPRKPASAAPTASGVRR